MLEVQSQSGDKRSCSTCHGVDVTKTGRQAST
ncbi:MAG: DUF1924 domain-containing protein [Gammaproteobacteria bacterium]|nr:DUF1924 domain-containing protein [Gammaproteobacteria bacterium]